MLLLLLLTLLRTSMSAFKHPFPVVHQTYRIVSSKKTADHSSEARAGRRARCLCLRVRLVVRSPEQASSESGQTIAVAATAAVRCRIAVSAAQEARCHSHETRLLLLLTVSLVTAHHGLDSHALHSSQLSLVLRSSIDDGIVPQARVRPPDSLVHSPCLLWFRPRFCHDLATLVSGRVLGVVLVCSLE